MAWVAHWWSMKSLVFLLLLVAVISFAQDRPFQERPYVDYYPHQKTVRMMNSNGAASHLGSELLIFSEIMKNHNRLSYCFERQLLTEKIEKTELNFGIRIDKNQKVEILSPVDAETPRFPHPLLRECVSDFLSKTKIPRVLQREYQIHLEFETK